MPIAFYKDPETEQFPFERRDLRVHHYLAQHSEN